MRLIFMLLTTVMLTPSLAAAACDRSCAEGVARDAQGCCTGKPTPGAAEGPCYGNHTCNTGLRCISTRCKAPLQGHEDGPCYGNGTCNTNFFCLNNTCRTGAMVGIEWISMPAGNFRMGSAEGSKDEMPVHKVRVRAFEIAKFEVTVAQYRHCVDAGVCTVPKIDKRRCTKAFINWGKPKLDTHPINCVDWAQARVFSKWIGARLPTESEWEYVARHGSGGVYPWGDSSADCSRVVMGDGADSDAAGCGKPGTSPICSKPDGNTKAGVCDLAGNIWEWVEDAYTKSYKDAPNDGTAHTSSGPYQVIRGGGWDNGATGVRATYRGRLDRTGRGSALGFRPARTPK